MEIPRELIYEEKNCIDEFGINDDASLNHLIYEEWLLNMPDLEPFKPGLSKRRLKVFNDAYYICTLILMHPTNEEFTSYAYQRCILPSVVFPLVYFYISNVKDRGYSNSVLLKNIEAGLKSEGNDNNLRMLIKCTENIKFSIPSLQFAQRKLTPELLADIPWYKVTGKFAKDDILKLMRYIPKGKPEWDLMLDAIMNAIKEYEWDYNLDLNYVDDNGEWCHDSPLDMTSTINYCEELKNKYEEMSLNYKKSSSIVENNNSSPVITDNHLCHTRVKTKSKGRPKAIPFEEYVKEDAPACFMEVLKEMLKGKIGVEAAKIIIACTGIWINKSTKRSVTNEFNISYSWFSEAMNQKYPPEEIEEIRNNIRSMIEKKTSGLPS